MRHTQLRSFHAVAKFASFSKAAEYLNITQPTITFQIKELESQYKVQLFYRQRNNNRLTDTGRQLYQQTLILFSLEEKAKKLLQSNGALQAGVITFGIVSPSIAMPLIKAFHTHYPDLDIRIQTGSSEYIRNAVLNAELDFGLVANQASNSRLTAIEFIKQSVVLAVPNDHKLAKRKQINLSELHHVPLIHRERGSTTRCIIEAEMKSKGLTLSSNLEIGSREGVREACINGLGVGYVGQDEFQHHPNISLVHIKDLNTLSKSYFIYIKEVENLPVIQAIIQLLNKVNH